MTVALPLERNLCILGPRGCGNRRPALMGTFGWGSSTRAAARAAEQTCLRLPVTPTCALEISIRKRIAGMELRFESSQNARRPPADYSYVGFTNDMDKYPSMLSGGRWRNSLARALSVILAF